ncbi:MAG: hypothetical protein ACYDG5_01485 [Dehalococcoidales bacterium]
MAIIIKNQDFTRISKGVKPDTKKRVVLPKELVGEDITFHIYSNSLGQILLDPQINVPASEAWLFNNPEALNLVRQGLVDAANGKISKVDLKSL